MVTTALCIHSSFVIARLSVSNGTFKVFDVFNTEINVYFGGYTVQMKRLGALISY